MSKDQIKVDVYWRMVPDYVWAHEELQATDVVVWCALLTYADSANQCFPSQAEVARRAGVSSATVRRSLDRLRDVKAVTSRPRGEGDSLVYTMHMLPPDRRGGSSPVSEGGSSRMSDRTKSHRNLDKPLSSADADDQDDRPDPQLSHTEAFEALADACGYDAEAIRKVGGGLIGRNAKVLREAGATREEIIARAGRYRSDHPEWDLTPAALVKWWPTLAPPEGSEDRLCDCGQPTGGRHDPLAHDLLVS